MMLGVHSLYLSYSKKRYIQWKQSTSRIYSRYIYTQRMSPTDATWRMVSAAQFVDDVNQDPVPRKP